MDKSNKTIMDKTNKTIIEEYGPDGKMTKLTVANNNPEFTEYGGYLLLKGSGSTLFLDGDKQLAFSLLMTQMVQTMAAIGRIPEKVEISDNSNSNPPTLSWAAYLRNRPANP
jgi:hypothetical protein